MSTAQVLPKAPGFRVDGRRALVTGGSVSPK